VAFGRPAQAPQRLVKGHSLKGTGMTLERTRSPPLR
jgi:hypothetical protein